MFRKFGILCLFAAATISGASQAVAAEAVSTILRDKDSSFAERLAAQEVRRYFYLTTGKLLTIADETGQIKPGDSILVATKDSAMLKKVDELDPELAKAIESLKPEQYLLKTIAIHDRQALLVVGGDPAGVLYGAYRLAEELGVRFYLHGDVVPDGRIEPNLPKLNLAGKPLFAERGIQPFHDFPEGPDWWNLDDYKAYLGQLPKMGMNFFALHTYPEGSVGPEPLTWIGLAEDVLDGGKVKSSYPARHFSISGTTGGFGYRRSASSKFSFGAAALFDRDDYGADYLRDTLPMESMTPEQSGRIFQEMGGFLNEAFTYAHRLHVKTCLGTEVPLTIPKLLRERLKAAGKDPTDPAVVQELYEGMFERIKKTHPLDYYWLWTDENWTWSAVTPEQIDAVKENFHAALAAMEKVKPPFKLATCGWVLGPPQKPSLFDEWLPKDVALSCINRSVGNTPVEAGFAAIEGRPKWAIPWMEDDPGMTIPQLWAGRMRRDAYDSLRYGCTGLLGIHWRTEVLAPNVSSLAKAAWDQNAWNKEGEASRYMPVEDFYRDWAKASFGPQQAETIAKIFARLDGHLPRPADWVTGPGSIRPEPLPWDEVAKQYGFLEELIALRPNLEGVGNLSRFDYWINQFRYLRDIAKVRCVWGDYEKTMEKVRAENDPAARKQLAKMLALPKRIELIEAFAQMHRDLLATVSTPGEMGNVANWQMQTLPVVLDAPGEELAKMLGENLPTEAMPSSQYTGIPRLVVPTVRTGLVVGESLTVKAIVLGLEPREVTAYWRPLGIGEFTRVEMKRLPRGGYVTTIPAAELQGDFEYFIEAKDANTTLTFPVTAPQRYQSVVVIEN